MSVKKKARTKRPTLIAWKAARKAKKEVLKRSPGEKRKYRAAQTNKAGGSVGRPTYFHPKYCKEVVELGKQGKSPTQIASHFGVARSTLNQRWRKEYPDFKEAFELAMAHAQAYWETKLHARIDSDSRGGGPAVTALTFMLARRFREDYRDSAKELTGARGTPLIPMSESLPTKEKVKAYLDAVKGGLEEDEEL